MWELVSRIILRNRLALLISIGLLTLFFGYQASKVKLSYEFAQILPQNDPDYLDYTQFKQMFGEDGSVLVIGIEDKDFFQLEKFNAYSALSHELRGIEGVQEVVSIARAYNLSKNDSVRKFDFKPLFEKKIGTQAELDSLKELFFNLPFYENLLINRESGVMLMAITLEKKMLNTKARVGLVNEINRRANVFGKKYNIEMHYSGLPYIRTIISTKIAEELKMFMALAALVTAIILFLFFRSIIATLFSMLVVGIGVTWSVGLMGILGYKITLLTGLIPPLMIVIGVPNCIFLLNKYHREYRIHANQIKALARTIQKIGKAALMTNATTAVGFVTFTITKSAILKEFGIVTSISIMTLFLLSLILIPVIFSFLAVPKAKHTKHLDNQRILSVVATLDRWVHLYRRRIYLGTFIAVIIAGIGVIKIKTTGFIVDDLPQNDPVLVDLKFFEKNFKGVMPFEISIDTKRKGGVLSLTTLNRMNQMQEMISEYPEFSKAVSLVEVVKFSTQAFYNGNPERYRLPNEQEKNFILTYATKAQGQQNFLKSFMDSTRQFTRVSVQMADVGSARMEVLKNELRPRIDSIFNPEKYNVKITGTSIIFLKGTGYLVESLIRSVLLAIIIISFLMALMFMNFRMVLISLIPNLIPLLFTAALMGYFGIALKPSTILIFSIAFGISVDNTIHFLAKYRQELRNQKWNISKTVTVALNETGVSMIYTSIVLFFGFFIFTASHFGGTVALGTLVSVTLIIALFANLLLLPSLLLSLEKSINARAMKEPLIQIYDEDEDVELDDLTIRKD